MSNHNNLPPGIPPAPQGIPPQYYEEMIRRYLGEQQPGTATPFNMEAIQNLIANAVKKAQEADMEVQAMLEHLMNVEFEHKGQSLEEAIQNAMENIFGVPGESAGISTEEHPDLKEGGLAPKRYSAAWQTKMENVKQKERQRKQEQLKNANKLKNKMAAKHKYTIKQAPKQRQEYHEKPVYRPTMKPPGT